ncbi:MAG TPA: 3-methyl-2-oxobutanoate hydroxymethyltransferase [Casimicrobiaceae bacterium]|nr:3-methyl-2-oxobutanoate hydroxymethyltransferase [Casimicrobiaceae bacterium]
MTVTQLARMAQEGEKIAMLTAYDASFAALCDRAGVDVLLVGDSLGMVIQGHATTLPVTLDELLYHTRAVIAGCTRPLVIADLPFGTYQGGSDDAYRAGVAALKAGAQMVKVEGGAAIAATVEYLTTRGVPVCGHVGLTPQSVHVLGGFKVQGKTDAAADSLVEDTRRLCDAGAALIVVECVPRALGVKLAQASSVPTIGIGAGPDCAGQVLVIYDALGIQSGKPARFVRNFLFGNDSVEGALVAYVKAVKDGSFPAAEHCF